MKKKELRTPAQLLVTAALAEAGLITNGLADGVSQNIASRFNADRAALITSRALYEDAKTLQRQHQATLDASLLECRAFIVVGRDILKPRLGTRYNQSWDATAMKRSLRTPEKADDIQAVMEGFKDYFGANPAYENPSLDITAAKATTLLTGLVAARAALNNQKA